MEPEGCCAATVTYSVGDCVNAVSAGCSWLAGVVTQVDEGFVWVKFPFLKKQGGPYKYPLANVKPFASQFEDGTYRALKTQPSRDVKAVARRVRQYEDRLAEYLVSSNIIFFHYIYILINFENFDLFIGNLVRL